MNNIQGYFEDKFPHALPLRIFKYKLIFVDKRVEINSNILILRKRGEDMCGVFFNSMIKPGFGKPKSLVICLFNSFMFFGAGKKEVPHKTGHR